MRATTGRDLLQRAMQDADIVASHMQEMHADLIPYEADERIHEDLALGTQRAAEAMFNLRTRLESLDE